MYYVFEGKEKYFRILTKGATLEIDTYTVHKWIARDYDTGKALFLNREKTYTPPTGTNAKKPANVYVTIPRELHTKFICLDNDICGTQQSNVGHARARGYQFCALARQFPARNFQGKDIKIAKQELEIWKSKENREKENSRLIEHKNYSSKRIRLIYRSVLSLTKKLDTSQTPWFTGLCGCLQLLWDSVISTAWKHATQSVQCSYIFKCLTVVFI